MKETGREKAADHGTLVINAQGRCPACEATMPVEGESRVWCWRCATPLYVMRQGTQTWLCRITSMPEIAGLGKDEDDHQEFFDESVDPDEGLHGCCPWCEERLFSWFPGRCRCEACGGLFVIHWPRGTGRYRWIIDEALFDALKGRVRMAWRDD